MHFRGLGGGGGERSKWRKQLYLADTKSTLAARSRNARSSWITQNQKTSAQNLWRQPRHVVITSHAHNLTILQFRTPCQLVRWLRSKKCFWLQWEPAVKERTTNWQNNIVSTCYCLASSDVWICTARPFSTCASCKTHFSPTCEIKFHIHITELAILGIKNSDFIKVDKPQT